MTKKQMRKMALVAWLTGALGLNSAVADTLTVGPFTLEAVERKISAGGFPNTSGNPFKRTPGTTYRVLHRGKPVVPPGTTPDRGAPWWEVRAIDGAKQPAVLLMESGAFLLTEDNGAPRLQELAARGASRRQWQWLDSQQGQPGPVTIVSMAHRPGPPRAFAGGGRWLSIYSQAVLDVQTLAFHRYSLHSSEVLDQLQRFYGAENPMLAFSPGGTQFVVAGSRDRPEELDMDKRFEYALIAFDFARQQGTVLPINMTQWGFRGTQDIDGKFANRVIGWRRGPDGREQAYLRSGPTPTD